jgi:hypothetical protein
VHLEVHPTARSALLTKFARRIASLLSWAYQEDKQSTFNLAKRLYALRSKIAHGNARISSSQMAESCDLAIRLTTKTISAYFITLGSDFFARKNIPHAELKAYFANLDADTGAINAEADKDDK